MAERETQQTWTIGELAERAGTTVKSVRFYSDLGLLPQGVRSAGGHRRFAPEALDRLRMIRSLRTLDLPLAEVRRVLDRDDALPGVVADRLVNVGSRLTELRWQQAVLHALHDAPAAERAERLRLLGGLGLPPSTAELAAFWRRWLPPRLPSRQTRILVEHAVPSPPDDPTPDQVVAFARLCAFVRAIDPGAAHCQPEVHQQQSGHRPSVLYDGLFEAHALTFEHIRAGRAPHPGAALDCFVDAYASARGLRDTPVFRQELGAFLAVEPRADGYWALVSRVTGGQPTPGDADVWLRTALACA